MFYGLRNKDLGPKPRICVYLWEANWKAAKTGLEPGTAGLLSQAHPVGSQKPWASPTFQLLVAFQKAVGKLNSNTQDVDLLPL